MPTARKRKAPSKETASDEEPSSSSAAAAASTLSAEAKKKAKQEKEERKRKAILKAREWSEKRKEKKANAAKKAAANANVVSTSSSSASTAGSKTKAKVGVKSSGVKKSIAAATVAAAASTKATKSKSASKPRSTSTSKSTRPTRKKEVLKTSESENEEDSDNGSQSDDASDEKMSSATKSESKVKAKTKSTTKSKTKSTSTTTSRTKSTTRRSTAVDKMEQEEQEEEKEEEEDIIQPKSKRTRIHAPKSTSTSTKRSTNTSNENGNIRTQQVPQPQPQQQPIVQPTVQSTIPMQMPVQVPYPNNQGQQAVQVQVPNGNGNMQPPTMHYTQTQPLQQQQPFMQQQQSRVPFNQIPIQTQQQQMQQQYPPVYNPPLQQFFSPQQQVQTQIQHPPVPTPPAPVSVPAPVPPAPTTTTTTRSVSAPASIPPQQNLTMKLDQEKLGGGGGINSVGVKMAVTDIKRENKVIEEEEEQEEEEDESDVDTNKLPSFSSSKHSKQKSTIRSKVRKAMFYLFILTANTALFFCLLSYIITPSSFQSVSLSSLLPSSSTSFSSSPDDNLHLPLCFKNHGFEEMVKVGKEKAKTIEQEDGTTRTYFITVDEDVIVNEDGLADCIPYNEKEGEKGEKGEGGDVDGGVDGDNEDNFQKEHSEKEKDIIVDEEMYGNNFDDDYDDDDYDYGDNFDDDDYDDNGVVDNSVDSVDTVENKPQEIDITSLFRIKECPQHGRCMNGKLIDCKLKEDGSKGEEGEEMQAGGGYEYNLYSPSADGTECILSSTALEDMLRLHSKVVQVTLDYTCLNRRKIGCDYTLLSESSDEQDVNDGVVVFDLECISNNLGLGKDVIYHLIKNMEDGPSKLLIHTASQQGKYQVDEEREWIGLSKQYIENDLPITSSCWVQLLSWDIAVFCFNASTTFLFFIVRTLWNVTSAYPIPALILGTVFYIIYWIRKKRKSVVALRMQVTNIQNLVYDKLVSDYNEGEGCAALHLRDDIVHELHPGDNAKRKHLITTVWPRVCVAVRMDNRVRKTRKNVRGKSLEWWEWVAEASKPNARGGLPSKD